MEEPQDQLRADLQAEKEEHARESDLAENEIRDLDLKNKRFQELFAKHIKDIALAQPLSTAVSAASSIAVANPGVRAFFGHFFQNPYIS